MAANTDVIAAGAVDLKLEAMRKDDYSWQPCEVYFSKIGGGLVVKYEDNSSQDTLTSEKEALMRIRARSLPLQDDDCANIKPGETVLVNRDSESEGEFFDAEVEKVVRVRHSKRTNCRCTFKIRWLNQDVNDGSLTVPSCSVMRLANKSINNHPTISAFMDSVQLSNSSDSNMSPQMDIVGDFDLDLHDLLEKQIEGIRNSVNGSKKRIRDEISMFEDVSKPNGRVPDVEISTDKSRSRRSTRSQKKGGPKKQSSPVVPPSTEDNHSDKKSPLNPLAARAAFASLMSHKNVEISIDVKETKTFNSSETEYSSKPDKIVKKLFSTSSSLDTLEEEEDDDDDDDDDDDEMNNAETATRSTRAKVQKVKVKVNGVNSDNKVSANRRHTRSTLGKEEETETKDTTTSHVQKDKNTLFATSSSKTKGNKGIDNEAKNSSNGRRHTRSVLNNEVSEEIETESTPGPTEQKNKNRKTSGKTQGSEGNVMSNGGGGYVGKKGLVDLKAQKVRCSPRLNPKA